MRDHFDPMKQKFEQGRPALGLYANDVYTIDLLAHVGFDWIMIDQMFMPHDWSVTDGLVRACQAAGITPVVRVQSNPWLGYDHRISVDVTRLLGMGVKYILVSHSCNKEIAESLQAAKGWHRKALSIHPYNSLDEWTKGSGDSGDRPWIIPHSESEGAIDEAHEVLEFEQLSAFFVAMTDASRVLTKADAPDWYNDRLWSFVDSLVEKGSKNGVVIGGNTSYAYDMREMVSRVKRLVEHGVSMILCQGAPFMLQLAANSFLRDAENAIAEIRG